MHVKVMVYGPKTSEELDTVLVQFSYLWGRLVSTNHEKIDEFLLDCIEDNGLPILLCTRDMLEEYEYSALMACNLVVEEEDGTFTILDRSVPHIWFKEWEVGGDTFDPLISNSKPDQVLYSMPKSDVNWEAMLVESSQLWSSNTGSHLTLLRELTVYCGDIVIIPFGDGYMQVKPFTVFNHEAPEKDKPLLQLIKELPGDTVVTLVDVNI